MITISSGETDQFREISFSELAYRCPGRVQFTHLPGFESCVVEMYGGLPLGTFQFDGGIICGAHGVLLTEEGISLCEQSNGVSSPDHLHLRPSPCIEGQEVPVLEEALSLCALNTWCFYHWMLDQLPKVIVAERCGFGGTYVIPTNCPWARESLDMLGIREERIFLQQYPLIRAKKLFVPTHFRGWHWNLYRELLYIFRSQLLEAVKDEQGESVQRIYLSRRQINRPRKVLNEERIRPVLEKYSIWPMYMEDYTLRQQIAIASRASVLIGPHGSGMLHSIFMPKGSVVLELFSPQYVNYGFSEFAENLQHKWAPYVAINQDGGYEYGEDIYVNPGPFETVLRSLLND